MNILANWPRASLAHLPTPLELLPRLSDQYPGHRLWMKRDDCTGLAMGGNKIRQLEFYLGDALAQGCDTVISTGAIQSNYMRSLAAAAAKLGLECHIQLESRVDNVSEDYCHSGNVLLDHLFGATIHRYEEGGDEFGADQSARDIAESLQGQGKKPYFVPLAPMDKPKGALGYVAAAEELQQQFEQMNLQPDVLVVGSGSGLTHAGLLTGMRLLGNDVLVLGACVRRERGEQAPRILKHCQRITDMLEVDSCVTQDDIWISDVALAPGYGKAAEHVMRAMGDMATLEGILLDPVYSAKTVATTIALLNDGTLDAYNNVVMVHTGGTPALFAYREQIQSASAFSV